MNKEYFEKTITVNQRTLNFWQLEIVSSNVDLNKGFLGCIGYETIDDMKARTNGERAIIPIKVLNASQSYQAVRDEALALIGADSRFTGAILKQYE